MLSCHEAGHVVVALVTRGEATGVSLRDDEFGPHARCCGSQAVAEAAVLAAGELATLECARRLRAHPEYPASPTPAAPPPSDKDQLAELDWRPPEAPPAPAGQELSARGRDVAAEIISQHWPVVEHLAAVLLERGELDEAGITAAFAARPETRKPIAAWLAANDHDRARATGELVRHALARKKERPHMSRATKLEAARQDVASAQEDFAAASAAERAARDGCPPDRRDYLQLLLLERTKLQSEDRLELSQRRLAHETHGYALSINDPDSQLCDVERTRDDLRELAQRHREAMVAVGASCDPSVDITEQADARAAAQARVDGARDAFIARSRQAIAAWKRLVARDPEAPRPSRLFTVWPRDVGVERLWPPEVVLPPLEAEASRTKPLRPKNAERLAKIEIEIEYLAAARERKLRGIEETKQRAAAREVDAEAARRALNDPDSTLGRQLQRERDRRAQAERAAAAERVELARAYLQRTGSPVPQPVSDDRDATRWSAP